MPLWGAYTSDESKPKYLTTEEKKNCFATQAGWVYKHPNGQEEVIVAIRGLAGTTTATRLGAATISSLTWITDALTADSTAITVEVVYNERVTVDTSGGTPSLVVSNDDTSGNGNGDYTLSYASGTGTNRLRFTATSLTLSESDVLSVAAQNVALNSGTIVDTASSSVSSQVAISSAVSTAVGTVTVAAGA